MKRDGIFQIVAEELFRKGQISEQENKILVKLARFLRLETEEARALVKVARMALSDASPVEGADTALRAYTRVSAALRTPKGPVSGSEQVLHALRVLFQMPEIRRTGKTPAPPPDLGATGQVPMLAVEDLPATSPLEEAAKLARLEQYDDATRAAERLIAVRPAPAGFADGYRQLLPSLLEEAAAEPTPNRVLPLVRWAARLALVPQEEAYRWHVLVDMIAAASAVLAKGQRWDEHAQLVPELEKIVDTPQGTYAPAVSKTALEALERCLAAGRFDEAREWHKMLFRQTPWFSHEEVRNRYATGLARQMDYIVGHKDDGREQFGQMHTALNNLIKGYNADKGLVKTFASVSPSIGVMYLKARDAQALKEFSSQIANAIKTFSSDEETALVFAKGLVNTAILAKEVGRRIASEKSAWRRFVDGFKSIPEPFIAEITVAMQVAVASCPRSEAMSDARKRFEGLSGARLLVTEKVTRPASVARPAIKASRLSRA